MESEEFYVETKTPFEDMYNEVLWNEDRELLQTLVEKSVKELAKHMGCNSFTLPFDNFTVKVTPSNP